MSKKYVISCINGYPPSQAVIDYGCWLAKSMNTGLKLFHTIDNQYHENASDLSGSIGLGAREEMLEEIVSIEHEQNKLLQKKSQLILESAKEHAAVSGVEDIKLCSRKGRLLDNLNDFKQDLSIVVIGKYGKRHQGMSSELTPVGHKVEGVVKKLDLPVFIVAEDFIEPESLLLSYDGSPGAIKVLDFLCSSLGQSKLAIDLVYFGAESEETQSMLAEASARLEQSGFKVNHSILSGQVDERLPKLVSAKDKKILAMGAFGHGALREFFLGSLTSQMIQDVKCPILLVR